MDDQPIQFVEKPITRKNSHLEPISVDTFMKYLERLTKFVEKEVSLQLPTKFGIVIDGWNEGTTHYIAFFANYADVDSNFKSPLLAIAPPFDEQDYSSESHKSFIGDILELYGKRLSDLLYLVGDNAPVNTHLADLLGIPFIGCASHRFNLACKDFLKNYEEPLSKINSLMTTLRNVKPAGKLKTKTPLKPVIRNKTRWSSTHNMLQRYFRIREFLDDADPVLINDLPTPLEVAELKKIMFDLNEFETTTKMLQEQNRTILEVRVMFDAILSKYPQMERYLKATASFVHSPTFETGIVKIQDENFDSLSIQEKLVLKPFLLENASPDVQLISPVKPLALAAAALKAKKRKIVESPYVNVLHIPPTSNIVERLFSSARLVLTDYRKSMCPETFESLLFLKTNSNLCEYTFGSQNSRKKGRLGPLGRV